MVKLLEIIAFDLTKIMYPIRTALFFLFFLFLTGLYLDSLDVSSHRGACSLLLVPIIEAGFSLLIFRGFFRSLRLVLTSLRFLNPGFLGRSLWFFGLIIFHWRALSIKFYGCGMTASGIVLIFLTNVEAGLKSDCGLGIACYFNYHLKSIELLVTLFYFYS